MAMLKKPRKRIAERTGAQQFALPPGIKLLHTLEGHTDNVTSVSFAHDGTLASGSSGAVMLWKSTTYKLIRTINYKGQVYSVAFDPEGRTLACAFSQSVMLIEASNGNLLHTLKDHESGITSLAFDPAGRTLASGSFDHTIKLWDPISGKLNRTLDGTGNMVLSVAFDPAGKQLASANLDNSLDVWEPANGTRIRTLQDHWNTVNSVTFDPKGRTLASGSADRTVKLWEATSGRLLRTLEGNTDWVEHVAFSGDGRLLASKARDNTITIWSCETWEALATIGQQSGKLVWQSNLAFHPTLPLLATGGSGPNAQKDENRLVHIWKLDPEVLLSQAPRAKATTQSVHHATAKIVLVGESGVGKTGLGWRLAHGEFKEHSSTHGQQFWILDSLNFRRSDGTNCEAILWDLAGQPDYRLIHALFLDDSDLALVLFDPTDSRDPLHDVEFWLKQLGVRGAISNKGGRTTKNACPAILVAARADRGSATLTDAELKAFSRQRGLSGYLSTSAKRGDGLNDLLRRMKKLIPWEDKAATVTTVTFKRIKDYVLALKENRRRKKVIVSPIELRKKLQKTDSKWTFKDAELMTAVSHLENYGYVRKLRTSQGEEQILLIPELLNNLAASFVLEARRNQKGLGSLDEKKLLAGKYRFSELDGLAPDERNALLDSAALLFLNHNVCFRESDPLRDQSYLVFPGLINLKKPTLDSEQSTEDSVAYTVSGSVENVYASLVVLLGYTRQFTRTNQWHNHARYEIGSNLVCGFRMETEQAGELDFVLYFGENVGGPVRTLFQGLFESFLARRNVNVLRYDSVACTKCQTALDRSVVRKKLRDGKRSTFCSDCGAEVTLPKAGEPIQLTRHERRDVEEQQWFAVHRSRFEQAIFQVSSHVEASGIHRPECFISYAWGKTEEEKKQERWVERDLATDLQKAGINVVLDRWENTRIGASVSRFIERVQKADRIAVVGTPLYAQKYANRDPSTGYAVAAEGDLITRRMRGTEANKESVLPLLLAGDEESSFPPLVQGRVFADFRTERSYFMTAFDLILSLYGISPNDRAVVDLRESLSDELAP